MSISRFGKLLMVTLIVSCVYANEYEHVADYRHESMAAIGVHFDAIKQIVQGELPFESHISIHANALAGYADIMPDLFPDGSEGGETRSSVWEEPEEFTKVVEAFRTATLDFKEVAAAGDMKAIAAGFRDLGNSCKGCHRNYRE